NDIPRAREEWRGGLVQWLAAAGWDLGECHAGGGCCRPIHGRIWAEASLSGFQGAEASLAWANRHLEDRPPAQRRGGGADYRRSQNEEVRLMRVLLDTNVILDAMLQRAPWHQEADAILQAAANGQVTCAATTLTLATTFYVGRKAVGNAAARAAVRRYLAAFI